VIVNRIERHQINRNQPMYKIIDALCFKSKNLYNYANYIIRQEFISNNKWLRCNTLDKLLQQHETNTDLGSQASQKVLQLLDKNWKSFFKSIKDWKKHSEKYLGRPKLPKYKKKDGRNIVMLKNIQCRIEDGYLVFSWKPLREFKIKTNVQGKLMQVRFVPKGSIYVMEIVYEKEISNIKSDINHIASIDLGLDNFVTIANNIGTKSIIVNGRGIKSYNQYWNKEMAYYRSKLKKENGKDWSKKLDKLTLKRNNKMNYFMHKASKEVTNYCKCFDINNLVVGYNQEWKQNCKLNKKVNQRFVQIPYDLFLEKLKYKCEDMGINFILTDESYTSGTSFLDQEEPIKNNYNKNRRIYRGLFKSNQSTLINADLNGAYQIMKKVFPEAFVEGKVGVDLHPIVISL
jgi:putative transposase